MLGIGEIAIRSKKHLQKRSEFIGLEHIKQAKAEGHNIILMVPHGWAIDASGIILHTHGMPMTSLAMDFSASTFWWKNACAPKWY